MPLSLELTTCHLVASLGFRLNDNFIVTVLLLYYFNVSLVDKPHGCTCINRGVSHSHSTHSYRFIIHSHFVEWFSPSVVHLVLVLAQLVKRLLYLVFGSCIWFG